ncbi:MAG: FHA domain-containing protein [Saprospiraceae bacterium]|nr:FHA domain-containing protein [Saprospiraceae bacterium]
MERKNYDDPNFANSYNPNLNQGTVQLNTNVASGGAILSGGTIVGTESHAPSIKHKSTLAGFLVTYSRSKNGDFFEIREGNNSIGTGKNNTIKLNEQHVSSDHAKINVSLVNEGKEWKIQIVDLSSANGTFVNSKRLDIYSGFTLKNNDVLKFGEFELLLMVIDRNLINSQANSNFKEASKIPDYPVSQTSGGPGTTNVSL